jgi:hypothetical protein
MNVGHENKPERGLIPGTGKKNENDEDKGQSGNPGKPPTLSSVQSVFHR